MSKMKISYLLAGNDARWEDDQRHHFIPADVNTSPRASLHIEQAPFFRLPPELRNRIYELVFGHKTIHIDIRSRIFHVVCQAANSDEEAYEISKDLDVGIPGVLDSYETRHERCLTLLSAMNLFFMQKYLDGHPGGLEWTKSLPDPENLHGSLQLLRVRKQIYGEAAFVPYYCNTFAFADGGDLRSFVRYRLSDEQRQAIISLQAHKWVQAPSSSLVRSLRRLKTLRVFVASTQSALDPHKAELYSKMKVDYVQIVVGSDTKDAYLHEKTMRRKERRQLALEMEGKIKKRFRDGENSAASQPV